MWIKNGMARCMFGECDDEEMNIVEDNVSVLKLGF